MKVKIEFKNNNGCKIKYILGFKDYDDNETIKDFYLRVQRYIKIAIKTTKENLLNKK